MTQLILKRLGEIVSYHREGSAVSFEGGYVSPAHDGWSHGGWSLEAAPAPEPDTSEPVPPTDEEILASLPAVSLAQMIEALVQQEYLERAEGDAWFLSGTLPEDVEAVIQTLPLETQSFARYRTVRPTVVEPTNQIVKALALFKDKSTADLVTLFQLAGSLD